MKNEIAELVAGTRGSCAGEQLSKIFKRQGVGGVGGEEKNKIKMMDAAASRDRSCTPFRAFFLTSKRNVSESNASRKCVQGDSRKRDAIFL